MRFYRARPTQASGGPRILYLVKNAAKRWRPCGVCFENLKLLNLRLLFEKSTCTKKHIYILNQPDELYLMVSIVGLVNWLQSCNVDLPELYRYLPAGGTQTAESVVRIDTSGTVPARRIGAFVRRQRRRYPLEIPLNHLHLDVHQSACTLIVNHLNL